MENRIAANTPHVQTRGRSETGASGKQLQAVCSKDRASGLGSVGSLSLGLAQGERWQLNAHLGASVQHWMGLNFTV